MNEDVIPQEEISLNEKIHILIEDLPPALQSFIRSPERDAIVLEISQKYNLHVDDAGKFEFAFLYMLLGIYSPDEFIQDLRQGGFDSDTIRGLTNDVNEMVFKKLRKEEQKESTPSVLINQAPAHSYRDEPVVTSEVRPREFPINQPPQVQAVQTPQYPQPVAPQPPAAVHPRTMQQDMQYVQQGNLHDAELGVTQPYAIESQPVPHQQPFAPIASTPAVSVPMPVPALTPITYAAQPQTLASMPYVPPVPPPAWHASAAASFQTASIPNTAPSQLNPQRYVAPPADNVSAQLPGTYPPSARAAIPPQQPQSFAPLKKEYGADPYREMPQ